MSYNSAMGNYWLSLIEIEEQHPVLVWDDSDFAPYRADSCEIDFDVIKDNGILRQLLLNQVACGGGNVVVMRANAYCNLFLAVQASVIPNFRTWMANNYIGVYDGVHLYTHTMVGLDEVFVGKRENGVFSMHGLIKLKNW